MADLIPLSDVQAAPPQQGAAPTIPDGLIPLDQVQAAPQPAPASAAPESTFKFTSLGPLTGAANAVHGFTDQAGRALSFGLTDKVNAAVPAVNNAVKSGYNWLTGNSDANAPSTSDIYHQELGKERAAGEAYAENHPVASKVATTVGTAATIPLLATGTAAAPSLLARVGQGVKAGAGVGALAGFGGSNDESLAKTATDTAEGAGIGGLTGGAAPVVAEHVVTPLMNWVTRQFSPAAAGNQAVQRIAQRIAQDTSGGGPSAQDMLDLVNAASPSKPITLADLGGNNVLGEAGRVARAPGPGKQTAIDTLNARDAGAGTRLAGDIDAGISSGGSAFDTAQALQQARAAAASPAYEAAGIPSNPADYAKAPLIDNPAVTRLLQKSKDVQSAIASAKSLPDYADLPDNSMVLLDKAYKNIGGNANAAKIAGNGESARDLNSLRSQLLDAITGGNADHPYQKALDAFSGPSQSMNAVEAGRGVLTKRPEEIASEFGKLSPGDQEFYKLGAADTLKANLARTGMAGDEAKKIIGNQQVQNQLRPLFSDQASYDKFINAAKTENRMFDTRYQTLGNSATAGRVAEDDVSKGAGGALGGALEAGMGLMAGEHVAPLAGGLRMLRNLGANRAPTDPGVNSEIAKSLFNTDPQANRALLAQIIARQNAPSLLPSSTVPFASLASQAIPALLRGR